MVVNTVVFSSVHMRVNTTARMIFNGPKGSQPMPNFVHVFGFPYVTGNHQTFPILYDTVQFKIFGREELPGTAFSAFIRRIDKNLTLCKIL